MGCMGAASLTGHSWHQSALLQNLFGKWSEGVYVGRAPSARCIWRPGSLPEDAELYYGFSRWDAPGISSYVTGSPSS